MPSRLKTRSASASPLRRLVAMRTEETPASSGNTERAKMKSGLSLSSCSALSAAAKVAVLMQ